MIPHTIHSIWIGGEIPGEIRDRCAHMKGLNNDMEYRLWGNELIERYRDDPYVTTLLERQDKLAFVADRLRVLLLRDEGGIYVDADAVPVRPFRSIAHIIDNPRCDFVAGMRSPFRKGVKLHGGISLVDNTVLLSAKGGKVARRLCDLWKPGKERQTGYEMGIEILCNLDDTVTILNFRYFYAEEAHHETICLHDAINLYSWSNKPNAAS